MESFEDVLLDDYKVDPFADPNGMPTQSIVLFPADMHFKMILQRKETNGFGDKAVLVLQAQCASLTFVEQTTTQHEFTGIWIVSREVLSFYLHHFSMAWDKTETAGNEYTNDALVDLFLSSLGMDNMVYYSNLYTALENQCADSNRHGTQVYLPEEMPYIQWFKSL